MSLLVQIAAQFVGKKEFKEADKAIDKLTKSAKKLAGAAGIGLSTAAIVNFGKKAAAAFMADEKAARQLSIAVKNLGIAFESPRIEAFISDLSAMTGITDDQLRPAMQRLLQTTGSVTKAQELLTQATDIAAGSGVDYETVVSDLSAAYLGQTKGLSKYSLGLTKAELKTMKFADIQAKLNDQFKGSNAAYLDTYAGKFALISNAAGEASEKIGGALVESLISAFAAGDPEEFVAKIEGLATKIASMVATAVFGFKKLYYLTSDQAILASLNPFDDYENDVVKIIDIQEKMFRASFEQIKMGYIGSMPVGIYPTAAEAAAAKKLEKDAIERAKKLAAAQSKQLAETKKKNALDKAAKTLDLERIGIQAALKGQISETDRLSLQLQLALLDKNDAMATKLAGELATATKNNADLQAALIATPEAPNPYRNWSVPDLGPLGGLAGGVIAGVNPNKTFSENLGTQTPDMPAFNVPQYSADSLTQYGPLGGLGAGVIAGVNTQPVNVTVTLDGKELTSIITETQVNDTLSGTFSSVSRSSNKGAVAML
jgi:hypothetical protein